MIRETSDPRWLRRSRKRLLLCNAALVGVPLAGAALLAKTGWPLANDRVMLLAIFAVELFVVWVPPAFYGAGVGPTTGLQDPRLHLLAGVEESAKKNSATAGKSAGLGPCAVGPALGLILLALSFPFAP